MIEYGLYVTNVERAAAWYRGLFGFPLLLAEDDRLRALQCGPRQVLLLFAEGKSTKGVAMDGGFIPSHDGSGPVHIAFAMEVGFVDRWRERLKELEIPIESVVNWPQGGTSLYFRDPYGHLLELITPTQWPFKQDWDRDLPGRQAQRTD